MASFSKPLNDYFNVRPEKEAEEKYKAATSEYEAPFKEEQETATTGEANAKAEESKAHADALRNPQPKEGVTPEEKTIHDLMTGENGGPRVNPQTGKPYSYMEAYTAVKQAAQDTKPDKTPNDFDQFLSDWLKDRNAPDNAHNRLLARKEWATAGQAPQHDPRQMIVGPDNKVIELKPGMTVPDGSKTVNGELTHKPSADEQKRADLVENLNENLDQLEDIVNRRPDLFGKIAGRTTKAKEWLGSDDPDIAALKGIEDRLGMVQQSSHGMRSAQHVEASANSLLNGFKNGADAMKRAISDARNSGKTFTEDAQRAKGEKVPEHAKPKDLGAAPEGSKEGRTGTLPDGTKVVVKGGRLVAQ
ncbi:MAG TPA: hypothetical protein VHV32_19405 [Candidatus Angelobacter sp.]|nr:hypothetical protein [Candidatus Angelobacter sp.]